MINDLWYKNAVIYCLSVGTFMDSNGDGIGDFTGLLRRLDYLQGLGVTCVWLMPFQPSPQRDHGYDISDYYNIDPRFGTLGDFVEFTHGAQQRGIRGPDGHGREPHVQRASLVSRCTQRPGFQVPGLVRLAQKKPANIEDGIVFPGVQKAVGTRDEEAGAWYFHRFYDFQPDLNTANPLVSAEILKIMGFWAQLGVSGFRREADLRRHRRRALRIPSSQRGPAAPRRRLVPELA